ncbi:GH24567 [Drosophila grimshawi]|uniref:GH24567 n=1 Tax=Drosophila grimshawi TaxID=7222 RepID=B4JM32_DROGR|nr:GH24567 [Drosophila grimshawi]
MLALITQSKMPHPWLQLSNAAIVGVPLKCPLLSSKSELKMGQQMGSRIPRMKKMEAKSDAFGDGAKQGTELATTDAEVGAGAGAGAEVRCKWEVGELYAIGAAAGAGTGAGAGAGAGAVPVVRSTRTSRSRIQLTHPNWTLVSSLLENRMCRLLHFECSDHKVIHVPSHLINRFSPLVAERQREPLFSPNRMMQLDKISAPMMVRLIRWMHHHRNDDLKQLRNQTPSVANANSINCTWDERFLGFNLDDVLELLLAANALGINPLVEHTILYYVQLIKQHNTNDRSCVESITQTLKHTAQIVKDFEGTDCSLN